MENKKIKIDKSNNELYTLLCDVVNGIDELINKKNTYLNKNDTMEMHNPSDPYETMSFRRGESCGLIIARDRVQTLMYCPEIG